jgi:hypothetical protein
LLGVPRDKGDWLMGMMAVDCGSVSYMGDRDEVLMEVMVVIMSG